MIRIIGGKAGVGIDVGGSQLGSPRLLISVRLARHLAVGSGGFASR
jgi:hypothetical protein